MNRNTQYVVFEGSEGCGKTTQTNKLTSFLKELGYSVLQTKEPGVSYLPLTMELRRIMLDSAYESEITPHARELVSQAIRSIHLTKLVYPAFGKYDFIIQDRGVVTGISYGMACGHDKEWLESLANAIIPMHSDRGIFSHKSLYNKIIYLKDNPEQGLARARSSKQEFVGGDAMENKGVEFMYTVQKNMEQVLATMNSEILEIKVNDKTINEVFSEIVCSLDLSRKG